MSLVAIDGTPLVYIPATRDLNYTTPGTSNTTQAAVNSACIMIGQIFWSDGGSHTVSTAGSSSLGWRTGARTLSNAGTTFKVGLAAVDSANGPPGRAVNVSDAITFDVSKSYTSGAPMTASAWNESVPDSGTKTIATGDTVAFCTQMTARGGADSIVTVVSPTGTASFPFMTQLVSPTYTAVNAVPNAVLTASDGTLGWFIGGIVQTTPSTTQTWNNTSTTKEYGNFFQLPFPMKIYGIGSNISVGGDCDFVIYSDPLGTPVAQKTGSLDANVIAAAQSATSRFNYVWFSSPYTTAANQPLAAIMKPSSATSVDATYFTLNSSAHQAAYPCGSNCYAVNRNTGAFAAQNSNKDRFGVGIFVGAFDSGGGTGGISRARAFAGFA